MYRLPYKSLSYYGGEGQYEESSESYCNFHIEIEDSNGSKIAHKLTSKFVSNFTTITIFYFNMEIAIRFT